MVGTFSAKSFEKASVNHEKACQNYKRTIQMTLLIGQDKILSTSLSFEYLDLTFNITAPRVNEADIDRGPL